MKAWELAETYLPENVDKLLDRVWDERMTIWASQMTFFQTPLGKAPEQFKDGFGSAPEKRITALREEVRRTLRPLAQLSDETRSSSLRAVAQGQIGSAGSRQLPPPK